MVYWLDTVCDAGDSVKMIEIISVSFNRLIWLRAYWVWIYLTVFGRRFYDVWSNIHYGYLGRYVGFDANTLLTGSDLQQLGKETFDEVMKIKDGKTSIRNMELKADTKDDITAMKKGIDLFERFYPATYLTEYLIFNILDSTPPSDLPYSKQIHVCFQ